MANLPREWKVRIPKKDPEKPDQASVCRVQLTAPAMKALALENNQVCLVWKADEPDVKYESIAYKVSSQNINNDVAIFNDLNAKRCGFELIDKICIFAAGLPPPIAESVYLRDVSHELPGFQEPIPEKHRIFWEIGLEKGYLRRAVHLFAGLTLLENWHGEKRKFRIESVNGNGHGTSNRIAIFDPASPPAIHILSDSAGPIEVKTTRPRLEVSGIAGIDSALEELNKHLREFEEQRPSPYRKFNPAILLHGPSGTGKTMIMKKIRDLAWGKTYEITNETRSSELRDIFKDAKLQPSILLIDELDSLVTKENSKSTTFGIENKIATELETIANHQILCIAATSQLNEIPQKLIGPDGFHTQISLRVPMAASRKQILRSILPEPRLSNDIVESLADRTPAYVGRDLLDLVIHAGVYCMERARKLGLDESDKAYTIIEEDADKALHMVRPSAMRDAVLEPPKVKWDEIGGQEEVKKTLRSVCERQNPELQSQLGLTPTKGLLLYGPPGCSKTLSAQAMATEASLNFFAVKGAELLNMYVGESERQVREVFQKARAASPSIIFFDEIESIGSKREGSRSNNGVNVLTTLLNEMDGIETLKDVTVLAATNQPEALDLALLRPGRFDKLLYVAPPDLAGRTSILQIQSQKRAFAASVDISELAELTNGYSGAELVSICNGASALVYEDCMSRRGGAFRPIEMDDFREAIRGTKKQISLEVVRRYTEWARRMGVGGGGVEGDSYVNGGDGEGGSV